MSENQDYVKHFKIDGEDVAMALFMVIVFMLGVFTLIHGIDDMSSQAEVSLGLILCILAIVLTCIYLGDTTIGYIDHSINIPEMKVVKWNNLSWVFYRDKVYKFKTHAAFERISAGHTYRRDRYNLYGRLFEFVLVAGEEEHEGLK